MEGPFAAGARGIAAAGRGAAAGARGGTNGRGGGAWGVAGLGSSFCYDYLAGSEAVLGGKRLAGFAIAPVKDLALEPVRKDRVSVLLLAGPSAEISFE